MGWPGRHWTRGLTVTFPVRPSNNGLVPWMVGTTNIRKRLVLSRHSPGLIRAMFAMKEIRNGNGVYARIALQPLLIRAATPLTLQSKRGPEGPRLSVRKDRISVYCQDLINSS